MKKVRTSSLMVLAMAVCVPAVPVLAKAAAHAKKVSHKSTTARHPAATASPTGAWTPDPKLLSQLQPAQPFGPYTLRIPVGYTAEQADVPATGGVVTKYVFLGPKREDGTAPGIRLIVATADDTHTSRSVDKLLNSIDEDLDAHSGVVKSDTQDGQINGQQASRRYFKYNSINKPGRVIHGFQYASTDGHTDARIEVTDYEPYHTTSLPVAEAAVLTLYKNQ